MQRKSSNFVTWIVCCFCLLAYPLNAEIFPEIKNPDTFIYATISDMDSMDPAYAYDVASHLILQHQIYEFLITHKGWSFTEFEPKLATQVPSLKNGLIANDGKTYTFPIRQGVKFHDGTPMTCEDARYSILRFMLMDRSGGPSSILLEPIAGVPATRDDGGNITLNFAQTASRLRCDGDNLIINLPKPYGPFLGIMAQWSMVVSKKWAAAHGDWDGEEATWEKYNSPKKETSYFFEHTNGTGPFELETWDKKTKTIILKRHGNYWSDPARLKRIVVHGVQEFATRKLLITKGDADYAYASWQFASQAENIPGVVLKNPLRAATNTVNFNFAIKTAANPYVGSGQLDGNGIPENFFADPDVRAGFVYCHDIDRDVKELWRNHAVPTRGVIPPGFLGHNPNQPIPKLDLKRAEMHFKKAFGGRLWEKGFRMVMPYNEGNDIRQSLANMLKRHVESLNPKFKIDVRPLLWSTYLTDNSAHKLPTTIIGWIADFPDPHNFAFTYWHSDGAYASRGSYKNPKANALVEKALYETDPKKREKLYYELVKIAYEDNAYIYSVSEQDCILHRDWVQNFEGNPMYPTNHYFYKMYKALK